MKIQKVNGKVEKLSNAETFIKGIVPNANVIATYYLTIALEEEKEKYIEFAKINQKEVYENILKIGNDIFKLLGKKNDTMMFDIKQLDETTSTELTEIIIKWCKENAYPYFINKDKYDIGGEFTIEEFVFDTVTLYLMKTINLYMLKVEDLLDEYEVDKNDYFKKINKMKFIFSVLCNGKLDNIIQRQYHYDYDSFPYADVKIESIEKDINVKNYIHYFSMYRKIMAIYLQSYNLKTKNIIYYTNSNQYDNQSFSNSCMDIAYRYFAYNEFINDLSVYICKNPKCINRFYKTGHQEFCQDCIDKKIPKKLRNMKHYQKNKSKN